MTLRVLFSCNFQCVIYPHPQGVKCIFVECDQFNYKYIKILHGSCWSNLRQLYCSPFHGCWIPFYCRWIEKGLGLVLALFWGTRCHLCITEQLWKYGAPGVGFGGGSGCIQQRNVSWKFIVKLWSYLYQAFYKSGQRAFRALCNTGHPSETHLKLKSYEVSCAQNLLCSCPSLWKYWNGCYGWMRFSEIWV